MRAKREKKEEKNKIKPILLIAFCIIIIAVVILAINLKEKNDITKNNNTANNNQKNIQIMAYIDRDASNEEIVDGAVYDSSIYVYCNDGEIENITYNNLEFEGTQLTEDGTYVITVKPNNKSSSISKTVMIDRIKPILQINDVELNGINMIEEVGSVVTLKDRNRK